MKKFLLSILLGFSLFSISNPIVHAFAETSKYSDVIEDLSVASNFDINNYPEVSNDYSLEVIQVAESVDNELFVYVYQPCSSSKEIVASTINLATDISNSKYNPKKYDLTLIDSEDTIYKYLVEDLIVTKDAVRNYEIIEINRKFDSSIDEDSENDNTINEITYSVAQRWTATTYSTGVEYEMKTIEVITLTNQYAGTLRFENGISFFGYTSAYDGHILAFTADKPIDKLMEIDLDYTLFNYYVSTMNNVETDSSLTTVEKTQTITCLEKANTEATGLFASSYSWDRIQTIDQFKASVEKDGVSLVEDTTKALEDCSWVVRFLETTYVSEFISENPDLGISQHSVERKSYVLNIDVMRLKYETDGIVYNVGVVSNTVTGDLEPDGSNEPNISFDEFWQEINKLFKNVKSVQDLMILILKILGIALGTALIIALIVMLLKVIPIHKWLAALITAPFSKNKKNKKKNKS